MLTGLLMVAVVSWASSTPSAIGPQCHLWGGGGQGASPRPAAQFAEIKGAELSFSYGFKIDLKAGRIAGTPKRTRTGQGLGLLGQSTSATLGGGHRIKRSTNYAQDNGDGADVRVGAEAPTEFPSSETAALPM